MKRRQEGLTHQIVIRIDEDMLKWLENEAQKKSIGIGGVVREIILQKTRSCHKKSRHE